MNHNAKTLLISYGSSIGRFYIGTTAETFHDYWLTPYTTPQGKLQAIPGVFLQAQMVSQLLSAALDGQPLLWTWPLWGEVIWVWGWSFLGGLLSVPSK
ncbi:CHASE2 domain-containing protein [Nostoc sp.]|uniref:CHASE2 domain-containing protein n=1 Tax=Nostoc sp. TaxID=1180 RepID=UPI003FA53E29